jgi:hypothetical protein
MDYNKIGRRENNNEINIERMKEGKGWTQKYATKWISY